jgi:nitrite reductase/ring-hydroxylating ferredoxin subunit
MKRRRRRDLDRMVEALLAGDPLPSGRLEPDEVEALRTAIDLRAARPGAALPDEEFVTGLRRRLAAASASDENPPASPTRIPRRALLAGAVGAVAAGVVGALANNALTGTPTPTQAATGEIVPENGQWVRVAAATDVAGGQVKRFATATTVGFVTEQDGTLAAVSGACTHQGCLLQLNQAAGRLDCPCHRTAFGVDGKLLFSRLPTMPAALPEIQVRSRDGQVEAFLPRLV